MEFQTWFKRGWLKGTKALLLYRQLWVSAAAQKHRGEVRSPQTGTQSCHLQPGLGWAGTAQLGCCCRVGRVWQAVLQPVFMTGLLVSTLYPALGCLTVFTLQGGQTLLCHGKCWGSVVSLLPSSCSGNTSSFLGTPEQNKLGFGCSG